MDKMTLAQFVRAKREEKNWSMRELAEKAGVSHTEIARIEKGERTNPSASMLRAIATALHIPITQLLDACGLADTMQKPIVAARIRGSEDLSEEELSEVENYIQFLKSKRKI